MSRTLLLQHQYIRQHEYGVPSLMSTRADDCCVKPSLRSLSGHERHSQALLHSTAQTRYIL